MSHNPILDLPKSQMYRDMTALGFYDLDSSTLVLCEMRAYQLGFQAMLELIDEITLDWWPPACAKERLEEWEGILGIPPRPGASLDQRRDGVLRFLSLGVGNQTPEGIKEALAAVGILGEIEEDFANRRVKVRVTGLMDGFASVTACMERARDLLPAHLALEVENAIG